MDKLCKNLANNKRTTVKDTQDSEVVKFVEFNYRNNDKKQLTQKIKKKNIRLKKDCL